MAPNDNEGISIAVKLLTEGLKAKMANLRKELKDTFDVTGATAVAKMDLQVKKLNSELGALSKHKFDSGASKFLKELQTQRMPSRTGLLPKDFDKKFTSAQKYIDEIKSMGTPGYKAMLPKDFDKKFKDASKYINEIQSMSTPDGSELSRLPDYKKWGQGVKSAADLIKEVEPQINSIFGGKGFDEATKSTKVMTTAARGAIQDLTTEANKGKREFAGWAMSIMFFGMALKRTFDTIWKSSTKTFNDVMHSTEGTVTKFDMLDGSMKYLGFTVGQALEPVVAFLIPIIDWVTEWVLQNQELAAGVIVALGVFGTLFTVIGSGKLAFDGFATIFSKVGGASAFGPHFFLVVAALTALAGLSWKAFKETPEAWESVKNTFDQMMADSLPPLIGALETVMDSVLGMSVSWEDFAWILAWVFSVGAEGFKSMANTISAVINLATALYHAFMAVGYATLYAANPFISSNRQKASEHLKNHKEAMSKGVANLSDLGNAQIAQMALLGKGPAAFKAEELARQQAEKLARINAELYNPDRVIKDFEWRADMGKSTAHERTVADTMMSPVININMDGQQIASYVAEPLTSGILNKS